MSLPTKYELLPPPDLSELKPNSSIYPDFEPWKHTELDDQILLDFVDKGYYQGPKVSFETFSGKSSVIQTPINAIAEKLSVSLTKAFFIRENDVNKIKNTDQSNDEENNYESDRIPKIFNISGDSFRFPKRVTLTDQRKEQWLQNLGDTSLTMDTVTKIVPHGFKKKQLLEQFAIKRIPYYRAIWLIKYCCSVEWISLLNKPISKNNNSGTSTYSDTTFRILKEWTSAMVHVLEKLIFDIPILSSGSSSSSSHTTSGILDNTSTSEGALSTIASINTNDLNTVQQQMNICKLKINYYIRLLGNCYSLGLVDKTLFINWLLEFFLKMENFEFYPISLHIITCFWKDIMSNDDKFLKSKFTECLLQKYYLVSESPSMLNDENYLINDVKRNELIRKKILNVLQKFIYDIFNTQSLELFIISNTNNWDLYRPCLRDILGLTTDLGNTTNEEKLRNIRKKFNLIDYRNETLKKNAYSSKLRNHNLATAQQDIRFNVEENNDLENEDEDNVSDLFYVDSTSGVLHLAKVNLELTTMLDNNHITDDWDLFIRQMSKSDIIQMILWSISPMKSSYYEGTHLVSRLLILKIGLQDNNYDIENLIWTFIFTIAKVVNLKECVYLPNLYSLLNICIGYGILKVPIYIRKLISSGILYLAHSKDKFFHCNLLINLKIQPVIKGQFNMVLKNMIEYDASLYENFQFNKLLEKFEELKLTFFNDITKDNLSTKIPFSVKILLADWYLNELVSERDEMLDLVDKNMILKVYNNFVIKLGHYHHFYRWMEYIIYRQILTDIIALETLTDIILFRSKMFPLLINDTNLFMKSIIHLYLNKLKPDDMESFQVIRFNPFWKFFIVSFPKHLELDTNLKSQLSELYEIENDRLREFARLNSQPTVSINQQLTKNIKTILSISTIEENEELIKKARLALLSLQIINPSEYIKYVSVILKRQKLEESNKMKGVVNLVKLCELKLLSIDFVLKIFGSSVVIFLLKYETNCSFYEHSKKNFLKKNYGEVLKWCIEANDTDYLIYLIQRIGVANQRKSQTCNALCLIMNTDSCIINKILCINDTAIASKMCNYSNNYFAIFYNMNFINLFYAQCLVKWLLTNGNNDNAVSGDRYHQIIFIMEWCNYDVLYPQLFNQVEDSVILNRLLDEITLSFFTDCFIKGNDVPYVTCVKATIIHLSQKLTFNDKLMISYDIFQKFEALFEQFLNLPFITLGSLEYRLIELFIELLIVYEKSLFDYMIKTQNLKIIDLLNQFFRTCVTTTDTAKDFTKETITSNRKGITLENDDDKGNKDQRSNVHNNNKKFLSLKTKLYIYDILLSMKTKYTYLTTQNPREYPELPKILDNLPSFRLSSFENNDETGTSSDVHKSGDSTLGILFCKKNQKVNNSIVDEMERYYLFDKKDRQFKQRFSLPKFLELPTYDHFSKNSNNMQHLGTTNNRTDINNTLINLSYFEARYDKKNPA
ncbi:uncharacterized protein SCODWIG_01972 [Saccharomycodes ludwigii]|uniref:Mediator of RNA polymerase II transcription subunit 12 n=1 Tax=Saccharomycodes ludwigii TaxID=36035 RepID=A0A376B6E9_9ASCO|nr:hypothetical protein SCDLUD_003756 [Saccharomycodes ludwigii]KAH3900751.1 hypothetical protein SCDLUD_003756 [Saccharomycodes ludwigii]SSD60211.1 uncharacterized protein SCODWIG_01972 [Saccharomycodes ludwigii]